MLLLLLVMSLRLGLFGLALLSLHLLMLISSVVVLFPAVVWFWVVVVLLLGLLSLVVTGFVRIVVMLPDAHGVDVFLYRDSSIAPLLRLRRRLKAVMDLVDAMIRFGVSLSRSVELSVQWDKILSIGPLFPVTLADFEGLLGVGLADFSHGVCCIHRRLCDFIHSVVVHRRDEAIRGWRNWIREDLLYIRTSGFGLIWFPLPHFSSVILVFHLMVRVFYLILLGLMRNSERPGFPIFVALGKGKPALRNLILRLRGGYHCCLRFLCLV